MGIRQDRLQTPGDKERNDEQGHDRRDDVARRLHRRRQPHDQRLGWPPPAGPHDRGGHPPATDDRPEGDENFVFVTTGIQDAVAKAKEIADGKDVGVNGGEIARQCFDAGLLDEVHVDLVPVFLGSGIPLLGMIKDAPVELDGPISVTEGKGVTHMGYRVVRK
jgi:hypothetical protein